MEIMEKATQIKSCGIQKLDLSLWKMIQKTCQQNIEDGIIKFKLTPELAKTIALMPDEQMHSLTSNIVLSFKNDFSEERVKSIIANESSDKSFFIGDEYISINPINLYYWQSLHKLSALDVSIAKICFGVSLNFTQMIATADHNHLLNIAQKIPMNYRIRARLSSILKIAASNNVAHKKNCMLQKIHQSI